jgi:hypothetical protein
MTQVRNINHIIVIQSLPTGDIMTGKELYDDVIKPRIDLLQKQAIKMTHNFFDCPDKNSFVDALKYVQANSAYMPGGILIHFELHGSSNKDGLVLADGAFISWKEIVELLRPINISTCNKLYITLATCYGRYLWLGIDPFQKSPYQTYISASKAVTTGEVIDKFNLLFELLIDSGDLIKAYTEHEKSGTSFYYKDSLTSFEDSVKLFLDNLRNDPKCRERIVDHPVLKASLGSGKVSDKDMDETIKKAFAYILDKQIDAFNFSDCK